ncbi:unnamed protein product [Gadus morhua 'NCC']
MPTAITCGRRRYQAHLPPLPGGHGDPSGGPGVSSVRPFVWLQGEETLALYRGVFFLSRHIVDLSRSCFSLLILLIRPLLSSSLHLLKTSPALLLLKTSPPLCELSSLLSNVSHSSQQCQEFHTLLLNCAEDRGEDWEQDNKTGSRKTRLGPLLPDWDQRNQDNQTGQVKLGWDQFNQTWTRVS